MTFQPSPDVEEIEEQAIKEEIRQLGQWKKSGQVILYMKSM